MHLSKMLKFAFNEVSNDIKNWDNNDKIEKLMVIF